MSKSNSTESLSPSGDWSKKFRDQIVANVDQQVEQVLGRLPDEYFKSLSEADQQSSLEALVAVRLCGLDQEVMLRQANGQRVTVISPNNYSGLLAELIERLPDQGELIGARIFTSKDNQFVIDIFDFQPEQSDLADRPTVRLSADSIETVVQYTDASRETIESFVAGYHPASAILESPEDIAKQFQAHDLARSTDRDLAVLWEARQPNSASQEKRYAKVTVSSGTSSTRFIFQRAADFFARYQIDIERAYCESIRSGDDRKTSLLTFHICIENAAFKAVQERFNDTSNALDGAILRSRLVSFLHLDQEIIRKIPGPDTSPADYFGGTLDGELFCGLARLTRYAIGFRFNIDVSREQVVQRLLRYGEATDKAIRFFQRRFSHSAQPTAVSRESLLEELNLASISDANDRMILKTFVDLICTIERCNLNLDERRSLAFRLPGSLLANPKRGETPFAIFYVFGRGFDGFHVRFRDVARGGMRLVPTRNNEHYLFESSRTYDEVFRLAAAQQLKNKDIAEGGSKAVVTLKPKSNSQRAAREFVDGLLDLIIEISATNAHDVTAPAHEYLYLGPDENVSNELIEWIVRRARLRGYHFPETIMSSKPSNGINHKEFGVTSEGVVVFLHHALSQAGKAPESTPFRLAMTGGPDGDVGGNAIRILIRDYGDNAKFVGIADGTGVATDADGLDHMELLRLVDHELGIAHFDEGKLGPRGTRCDVSTEEGVSLRNNLPFRIPADVFVPAGGRPSTINANNWEQFLDASGKPKTEFIVEGANLFVTETARKHLSDAGVTIVKDSSANKCGVICSSLEIIAGMLVDAEAFESIKKDYVEDVLKQLRSLASIEAISLFNEQRRQPKKSLPELSIELSKQIIRVADVTLAAYDQWLNECQSATEDVVMMFLPKALVRHVGGNVVKKIPIEYRKQLFASIVSSRIVYREGIKNIEEMTPDSIEHLVRRQILGEIQIMQMIESLEAGDLRDREAIIAILNHAGARAQRELNL